MVILPGPSSQLDRDCNRCIKVNIVVTATRLVYFFHLNATDFNTESGFTQLNCREHETHYVRLWHVDPAAQPIGVVLARTCWTRFHLGRRSSVVSDRAACELWNFLQTHQSPFSPQPNEENHNCSHGIQSFLCPKAVVPGKHIRDLQHRLKFFSLTSTSPQFLSSPGSIDGFEVQALIGT